MRKNTFDNSDMNNLVSSIRTCLFNNTKSIAYPFEGMDAKYVLFDLLPENAVQWLRAVNREPVLCEHANMISSKDVYVQFRLFPAEYARSQEKDLTISGTYSYVKFELDEKLYHMFAKYSSTSPIVLRDSSEYLAPVYKYAVDCVQIRKEMRTLTDKVETMLGVCSTWGQVARVLDGLSAFLPDRARNAVAAQQRKSRLTCLPEVAKEFEHDVLPVLKVNMAKGYALTDRPFKSITIQD
jgi:hypothetical protein